MTRKLLIIITLAALIYPINSYADVHCTYSIDREDMQREYHYNSLWSCNWDEVLEMWDLFDFDEGDWDSGFGFHDACNDTKPLKRVFNALQLLKYAGTAYPSKSCGSTSDILLWSYYYSANAIDELDAKCYVEGAYAKTYFGPFIDKEPFFPSLFSMT